MDYFHRAYGKHIGKGGMRCPCCGPARKHRAAFRRIARHIAKREVREYYRR